MKNTELAQKALALYTQGFSYRQIKSELNLRSRASAAGYIYRARKGTYRERKPREGLVVVGTCIPESMLVQLRELAAQWDCSLSEAIRTLIVCGLEDIAGDD